MTDTRKDTRKDRILKTVICVLSFAVVAASIGAITGDTTAAAEAVVVAAEECARSGPCDD